ncbi:hypothetical protein [Arthrobacter sp. C9C5]|uniref:hypothetical protein n=1 Tax=Arthrobacter sp. C9C5 TaxID=2735267 RepID=UPI00181B2281|nr:hypothetical protein [Arthrobacter sp. C9C5]NUU30153.1 hypothetical protein [Arthrobacter sp. C9C5]
MPSWPLLIARSTRAISSSSDSTFSAVAAGKVPVAVADPLSVGGAGEPGVQPVTARTAAAQARSQRWVRK